MGFKQTKNKFIEQNGLQHGFEQLTNNKFIEEMPWARGPNIRRETLREYYLDDLAIRSRLRRMVIRRELKDMFIEDTNSQQQKSRFGR